LYIAVDCRDSFAGKENLKNKLWGTFSLLVLSFTGDLYSLGFSILKDEFGVEKKKKPHWYKELTIQQLSFSFCFSYSHNYF
jgi:hypothetical protein